MERMVNVQLTVDEIIALGNLILPRLEYLARQPRTPENLEEMSILRGFVHKISPQVSTNAQAERNEQRAQNN